MNAVNLIPSDRLKRSANLSASPATLVLIGGLVVALAAAVLYVFAVKDVRARKSELTRVTANAASWQAAANSYTSYATAAQQRTQQIANIRQLVAGRFPWYVLLSQIGGVMPADAALSSLQATPPSVDATAATASAGASTASTAGSAVSLSGCAASQSAVAATMVALRRVRGVGSVSLTSSSRGAAGSGSGSAPSSGSSGGGSGGCPFPVTFQMSLVLASPAATPATMTPAATPAATSATPAATPTASVATSSTGAAQ